MRTITQSRFYKRSIFSAALLCLLLLPTATEQSKAQVAGHSLVPIYKLTDIGFLPGFTSMYPVSINIHGDVAGTAPVGPGLPWPFDEFGEAFLYSNGQLTIAYPYFSALPGDFGEAIGINAQKEVVGRFLDYGDLYSFTYQNGELYEFNLPGTYSYITGINDFGQIIGSASNLNPRYTFSFLFTPNAPVIQLPTVNGSMINTVAINNLAQIAGDVRYEDVNGVFHSDVVITQPGGTNPSDLGNLGGPAYATGLNIWGQVVGYSATTSQNNSPVFSVLYSQGKIINLGLPKGEKAPQYQSFATGINDLGVIVGYSDLAGGQFGQPSSAARGVVYLYKRWYDLNTLVNSSGHGLTIIEANGVNDFGQIAASALDAAGDVHAVILTVVGLRPANRQ
jgi:uncharacterized membrane protein